MVTRTRESAANSQRERYSANHDPDHDAGNEPEVSYSPDRSEAAHQDHAMRFEEAISGQARAAYRNRKDLMDYSAEDRKEVLREWVEGFHGTVFESGNERLDAARDIAASVFRPYHDRLDAREYETSKLSPEEPFDIYVVMGANMNLAGAASATGEGAASDAGQQNYIDIKVKNLEEAQRIMQETGGQARITYLERHHLQAYENRFAAFLMQSREDPDSYVSHLEETLSGASAFSRGEDDLGFWQNRSFDWRVEHEKSDEVAVAIVIDSAVAGNWSTFDAYLDYLRDQGQDVSQLRNYWATLARAPHPGSHRGAQRPRPRGVRQNDHRLRRGRQRPALPDPDQHRIHRPQQGGELPPTGVAGGIHLGRGRS